MDVLTFSNARSSLKEVMDRVVADHSPVVIARPNGVAVVPVSLADWQAVDTTLHLLSTNANAERLRMATAELNGASDT